MKEREIDPNRLAALLEGRLQGADRERLLEELAETPEVLAAYSDAAAVVGGIGGGAASVSVTGAQSSSSQVVTSIDSAPSVRRRWMAPTFAAAALVVLAVGVASYRRAGGLGASGSGLPMSLLESGTMLPAGFDRATWSTTRGNMSEMSREKRAARVGTRFAELLMLPQGDVRRDTLARELGVLLGGVDNGEIMAKQVTRIALATRDEPEYEEMVDGLARAITGALPPRDFAVAAWIEWARVAVDRRDVSRLTPAPDGQLGADFALLLQRPEAERWKELSDLLTRRQRQITN